MLWPCVSLRQWGQTILGEGGGEALGRLTSPSLPALHIDVREHNHFPALKMTRKIGWTLDTFFSLKKHSLKLTIPISPILCPHLNFACMHCIIFSCVPRQYSEAQNEIFCCSTVVSASSLHNYSTVGGGGGRRGEIKFIKDNWDLSSLLRWLITHQTCFLYPPSFKFWLFLYFFLPAPSLHSGNRDDIIFLYFLWNPTVQLFLPFNINCTTPFSIHSFMYST